MSCSDNLPVLVSVNRKHVGKQFRLKDGEIKNRGYGSETHFRVEPVAVDGIRSLARALEQVSRNRLAFVVRGELLAGVDPQRALRRSTAKKTTGERATFAAAARHWFLVDVDEIACPAAIDPRSDPEAAVEYVLGLLPSELWDAWCWWQFSSQQSVYPDKQTIRVHLWFWSEVPLDDAALTRWAIAANTAAGYKLVDPAPFRTVQPHYVAVPDFVAPLVDPLRRRCGLRQGLDEAVSLIIPPPHPKRAAEPGTGYTPGQGVEAYLAMIGGPAGFREPIKKAIASFVGSYGAAADIEPLKTAIRARIDQADPGGRSEDELDRYKSDAHLDDLIGAIRTFQGDTPGRGFTPEPPAWIDAAPPHPGDNEAPEEDEAPGIGPLPAEFSEEALALQFSALHGGDWRYTALWGKWMQWVTTHWRGEDTLRPFDLARAICRRNSAQATVISDKLGRDVCRAGTVAAVERLARADRRHAMRFDQYDAADWDFNQPSKKE